ncbi:hypothetical protein MMC30_005274 [Trapelia coarctata]|nr:hypothetical protein [Trapelia coarctata]
MVMELQDAHGILVNLTRNLEISLGALRKDPAKQQLQDAIHDDKILPEIQMTAVASKAINLLHQIEQLLEPASLVLADHFLGYVSTKCLCAAVELHVADILAQGPRNLDDLATASNARADRLGQVLRPLHNNGIFSYDVDTGIYSNNHTSELLRSDHWTQWHNWVDLYGNEFYDIARGIPQSVHKDAVRWAAQINFDTDQNMFTYFQAQGWLPRLHKTLGSGATAQAPGIVEDYAWEEVADQTIIDIGGGGGALIASLLRRYPHMTGGVFDLDSVIEHITPFFSEGGQYEDLAARVPRENLIAGNFLKAVPAFQVYTMKWVLHDWKDEEALTILRNIRQSIIPGAKSRLIILESILTDGRVGRLSRYGDINMMMTANGQERTEGQWRQLAEAAGWKVSGIYPLRNAWVQAIELKP